MRRVVLVLAFALGCRAAGTTGAVEPNAGTILGPTPGPPGCIVRAIVPSKTRIGSYPSLQIRAIPEIRYYGKTARPSLEMTVTKPDGTQSTRSFTLLEPALCSNCLPTVGDESSCRDECRWPPYEGERHSLARELDQVGEHQIEFELHFYRCRLEGEHATVQVRPPA